MLRPRSILLMMISTTVAPRCYDYGPLKRSAQQFDCHPAAELAAAGYSLVDELNIDVEPD